MSNSLRFGSFEVDLDTGQLRKRGIKIKLRDQSFQVLATLLEHPGTVVTRDELRHRLWHDQVFVDFENNLNIVVGRLREALGDSADHPRFIETLPKRGYRFVAPVSAPMQMAPGTPARCYRIVVLPFVNLTGDPSQDYLCDGITDEVITELASLQHENFAVIARTTAMFYKGRHKDVSHIARELSLDYVVEGSLRRSDDNVIINVQLIQTRDQTHIFAEKYEANLRDLFHTQRRIAEAIGAHIPDGASAVRTSPARARPRNSTSEVAAYSEYIRGLYLMGQFAPESLMSAKQHYERAIALDPEFPLPYDALAELYWFLGYEGVMSPRKAFSRGIVHALRALEIDKTRAETHALLAQFHKIMEYNWPEVEREMALALQLDPNSPIVRIRYAVSGLMPHGRLGEAIAQLEQALDFDPLSLFARSWLGIMLHLARNFDRGFEEGKKLFELDPTHPMGYFVMACGYRYHGKIAESIDAQRKAVAFSNDSAAMMGWLGLTLGSSGEREGARDVLSQLHDRATKGYVPASSLALTYLGLGELDEAFRWFNQAVDDCDQFMMPIKSYAFLDPIRSDPRFHQLLRKMNLGG